MKLLYLIDTIYNSSGMERVLTTKANHLSREYGYDVTIVTSHQMGRAPFFPLDENVRHIDLHVNTHMPYAMPRYIKRLNWLLEREKPDFCISLCGKEVMLMDQIKTDAIKMAEFHFSHDTYAIKGQYKKLHNLERSVGKLDCFVALTKEDKEVWKQYCNHLEQIYNPTSYPTDGPTAQLDAKRCISAGRFERQKNYQDMIEVWKLVHEKHPDWKLDLFGDGKKKPLIRQMIHRLGLQDSITIHSATKKLKEEMLGSSAYLMTSRFEGFPMVLVETAALGLPTVSYRCPCGPGEFIEDGVNGFTTEPGDIPGMADKICRLIEDEPLRKSMGRSIRAKSQDFTEEKIMPQWDALFCRLYQQKHAE